MNEAQSVQSKATQSLCAQCGLRLDSTVGGDKMCIHCLLRASLGDEDVDRAQASHGSGQEESTSRDRATGMEFGDYQLLKELGRGSQGVVYRARQKSLNRTVALKIIAFGHWASEARVKRFRREAEAAASLNHPGIVPIYEVGEREGTCYFSMRFVEGGQLDAIPVQKPMSPQGAAELIATLARIVQYAHEHGILHRDIKPGNILLDEKGEPHLTDFGLARLVETESTVTGTRDVMGTPSYMAPEQAAGRNDDLTPATDIYGLGAVMYQLLTDHPPFAGETTFETMQLVLDSEPRHPRGWNPKTDRELSTICLKCLEKDPKRRYSSALALAEDLERWLNDKPICAKRSGFFTHARKWVRRKPAVAALIALLILFAATIGWIAWNAEFILRPVINGVAVLPFENLSGDPDNAYFGEGIQEEILTRLAGISGLKVISRTSTQQYQSKPRNLRDIAKQIGVANIVEGSVQKVGDQVRVNVQLINAQNDTHLWADTYDRKLTDILEVESEIAKRIAESLQAKLTHREAQALAFKPTNNPEAYDAYLRGLAYEARAFSLNEGKKVAGFYEQAAELDPNFAIAWARLSRADALIYFNRIDSTTAARGEAAKRALENAQKVAPDSPETLLASGYYQFLILSDYALAKTTFERVGGMLPGSSGVPYALARVTRREGNWDESVAYYEQALTLDPRSMELLISAAETYVMLRQFPAALKLYDRALDITPNDPDVMASKAGIYQAQGNLQEAARVLSEISWETSSEFAFVIKLTQLRLQRNYGEAIRLLQTRQAQFHFASPHDKGFDQVWLALMQRLAGDNAGARATAEQARNTLEQLPRGQPEIWTAPLLSQAYALMGEKNSAVKISEQAIALCPSAKDRVDGPLFEENLAFIGTIIGENNRAISILSELLRTPSSSWSYNPGPITRVLLRLDPLWDPLRSNPAFQKLCEEKQK